MAKPYSTTEETKRKIQSIAPTNLAYMAGLIDGEGSITLMKCGKYYGSRLGVHMTDHAVVEWLADVTGVGRVRLSRREGKSDIYKWEIFSRQAYAVLSAILPYLKSKKPQAELIIERGRSAYRHGSIAIDEQLKRQLSALNQKKGRNSSRANQCTRTDEGL